MEIPSNHELNLLNFPVCLHERHRSPERTLLFCVSSAALDGTNEHTDFALERTLGSLSCGAAELSLQLARRRLPEELALRCLASLGYTPILTSSGEAHTIICTKSLIELTAVCVAFAAELSLQILSFLERVWIDAY